jgi:hypothetical protein
MEKQMNWRHPLARKSFLGGLTISAFSTLLIGQTVVARPLVTQYFGASTFGIGYNNPISAWANASMWQSATASVAMRQPLINLGYSHRFRDWAAGLNGA